MAEITVEDALKELREMFPKRWITITASTHSARANSIKVSWTISVNQLVDDFEAATLADCMDQVRAWHKAQELNTVLPQEQS